ncbi:MAG: hypothetical protein JJE19_03120 [Methanosarcinales archaeon]|nr:hypothetical protein [Methanosarcinales archaeon]
MRELLNLAFRILTCIAIFIGVTFFVAWLLESRIFFSLFIGIPVGVIGALAAFAIMTRYHAKK